MAFESVAPPASPEPRSDAPVGAAPDAAAGDGGAADAAVIAAVLGGDAEAYAILVHRYRDTYTRVAVCLLDDPRAVDDALQAAFVRAFNSLDRCPPEGFGTWLYALVLQECEAIEQRADGVPGAHTDDGSEASRIRRALQAVPLPQREAFVLRYVEELSFDEMVRLTGLDDATLRVRVQSACGVLRVHADRVRAMTGRPDGWTREEAPIAEIVAAPLRGTYRSGSDLEGRVMSAVRIEARVRTRLREGRTPSGAFATQPGEMPPRRMMPITPLGLAALVAVVGLAGAGLGIALGRTSPPAPWSAAAVAPVQSPVTSGPVIDTLHLVRFMFVDSAARNVSLVGDFNAWAADATPMVRDSASGTWTVAVPLSPGRHQYAFVVDGTRWALDPAARTSANDSSRASSELDVARR